MKTLFSYINYRLFLREYYEEKKATTSFFSYRWFAQKACINSPAFLKEVIMEKRNLTTLTVEKFIMALDITEKEAEYFRVLVGFNQAKNSIDKQRNYTAMLSMADFVKEHQIDSDNYTYFEKWYISVIREMVILCNFKDNYEEIGQQIVPQISSEEVKRSIDLLVRLGFLRRNKNGEYIQENPILTSGKESSEMMSLACRSFNRQMIQHAGDSLDLFPVDKRYAVGVTVGVSDSSYKVLTQEIANFRERIIAIVNNDKESDQVYQVNLNIFPVSQKLATHTHSDDMEEL